MPTQLIPQANQVELDPAVRVDRAVTAHNPSFAATSQPVTNHAASTAAGRESKNPPAAKPGKKFTSPLSDLVLKFKIDSRTNEVTLLILDRVSRKVVRSIPPEEMARIDPGELLELFT